MTGIPTVDLGRRVAMPMVGFGTWQLSGRPAYEAIRYALEVGYRGQPDPVEPGPA